MESGSNGNVYLVVAAVSLSLLSGITGSLSTDNVIVEVKLEKELHIITRNSTLDGSESDTLPIECVIHDLSPEELALFSEGQNHSVIVSTKYRNFSKFQEDSEENDSAFETFNVNIQVINDTLVVKGSVKMIKEGVYLDSGSGVQKPITTCEVLFLDANDSYENEANITGRKFSDSPVITSPYFDHVVLMNGAPEQVISCTANSSPPPQIRWIIQNQKLGNVETLSRDHENSPESTTSYLLFPTVDASISGNYTCVAENKHGNSTKTFEVQVISVESLANCNSVIDGSDAGPGKNHAIIFKQNIHNILQRSKRHLWYQWRTTRINVPPFNRPLDSSSPGDDHDSDMQKLVNLIAERLQLADKVAVNKWDNNLPVEDIPREQAILENMVRQAEIRGLDPEWAHRFFKDQIEANKDVQNELIRIWEIDGQRPPGPPVDLGNEVRPEIDRINGELLTLAKSTEYERRQWKCRMEVEKNARYAVFLYNLGPLHQRTLQRATESLCTINPHDNPPFPYHPYPPSELY